MKVLESGLVASGGSIVAYLVPLDMPIRRARTCYKCGDMVPVDEMADHLMICGNVGWGSLRYLYGRENMQVPLASKRKRKVEVDTAAIEELSMLL